MMSGFGIFRFCWCKEVDHVKREKSKEEFHEIPREKNVEEEKPEKIAEVDEKLHGSEESNRKSTTAYSTSSSGDSVRKRNVTAGSELLHISSQNVDFAWARVAEESDLTSIYELLLKKRNELHRVYVKLKTDLKRIYKMRETVDSKTVARSANLPDVVASDLNYSDSDFLQEFRQACDGATTDLSTASREVQELSEKYGSLVERQYSESELKEDAQILKDCVDVVNVLKQAMKIATIEFKLKLCLSDPISSSSKQSIDDLESALLEIQRLRNRNSLEFNRTIDTEELRSEAISTAEVVKAIRDLFPLERILSIEKESKLKLAELHIQALDIRHRQSEARFQLEQAISCGKECDLNAALNRAKYAGVAVTDELRCKAENLLSDKIERSHACLRRLKEATGSMFTKSIQKELEKAASLKISEYDSTVVEAKRVLTKLQGNKSKMEMYERDLKTAMKKKNAQGIEQALVDIKSLKANTEESVVEEATALLISLNTREKGSDDKTKEAARLRLLEVLNCEQPHEIANALVQAQSTGLNCVEIMGVKAKLVFIQGDEKAYASEMKKLEDYLEKLAGKAERNDATADTILTLDRAVAVASKLKVSPDVVKRSVSAVDALKERKENVKRIKDELQRAVMECRYEAITCAIAEAESLPYFLTLDPLDGQISAILEYAKNKLSSDDVSTASGKSRTAIQRVRSNLKRAMKGDSSKKLATAISLYRRSLGLPDKQDTNEDGRKDYATAEEEDNAILLRRAERRRRRMKRQERLAAKEWEAVHRNLRENLKAAMKEQDRAELWKAVYQFKRELGLVLNKEDEILLIAARKQLREATMKQLKSNLHSALRDRDATRLKHALSELETPSHSLLSVTVDEKFEKDIYRARVLLQHLKETEKLRKSVSEMNRSQIAEIHRYPSPPDCVRAVMTAIYLLVGENEKVVKDWTAVMRLMVKMGRESLTRRVAVCNPGHVPLITAHKVNDVLSGFTLQQTQDVSKSASVFFAWAKCMAYEVIDRNKCSDRPVELQKPAKDIEKAKDTLTTKNENKSEFWNRLSRPRSSGGVNRPLRSLRLYQRPTSAAGCI